MSQLRDSLPKPHPHGEDEGTEGSYERTLKNHNNYIKTKPGAATGFQPGGGQDF